MNIAKSSAWSAAIALTALIAPTAPAAKQLSLTDLFDRVNPSVVVLHTVERRTAPDNPRQQVSLPGLGSGVLIDDDGHIVTAAHVVQTADVVMVEFITGAEVMARVVASDPTADVSLLKVEEIPDRIRPSKLADSDTVATGSEIFVIGAPYGLGHSLTVGHISGRHKGGQGQQGMVPLDAELFQTDASINQGNSGGPMFNQDGEVIGIVSYILSRSGGFEGLGFAVTSNTVRAKLFEQRSFWTGMTGVPVYGELGAALNVPQPVGYLVQKVARDSPAERMGLRASTVPVSIAGRAIAIGGDIILKVGEFEVSADNATRIQDAADALGERQKLVVRVLRAGQILDLDFYGFHKGSAD